MRLFHNAFSPFARKVRLVLDHKNLPCEYIDGLALANHDALAKVNGRIEVPVLDHDGVIVVGSSDIVAYLERVFLERSVYPKDAALWAKARAWERCADTTIDAILINLSYWMWAERDDVQPTAWLEAARRDLDVVYMAIERDLTRQGTPFVCGQDLSIADIALFPHLTATRSFGVGHDVERHPHLHAWLKRLRAMPFFTADLERVKAFLASGFSEKSHERKKIFWRGDRLEWVLAHGFHEWMIREIKEERVLWPGLGVPT